MQLGMWRSGYTAGSEAKINIHQEDTNGKLIFNSNSKK